MTKFESIKSKNIDEIAEWLDKYGMYYDVELPIKLYSTFYNFDLENMVS